MKTTTVETKEVYKFNGIGLPVRPKIVVDCLLTIYDRNNKLTPELVVENARDKKSELHPCFEWNDKVAAQKHRIEQARKMINCVVVEKQVGTHKTSVRAFINIRKDERGNLSTNPFARGESSFVYVDKVMSDPQLRKYTLDQALLDLNNLMDKYNDIQELSGLFEVINDHLLKLNYATSSV